MLSAVLGLRHVYSCTRWCEKAEPTRSGRLWAPLGPDCWPRRGPAPYPCGQVSMMTSHIERPRRSISSSVHSSPDSWRSPNSTSMAASSAADGIVHREGPSSRTRKSSQVSPGYRSQCRLRTGAASAKCRAGTGARVSPSYRNLTHSSKCGLEREKGFEPSTLCLGSTLVAAAGDITQM